MPLGKTFHIAIEETHSLTSLSLLLNFSKSMKDRYSRAQNSGEVLPREFVYRGGKELLDTKYTATL